MKRLLMVAGVLVMLALLMFPGRARAEAVLPTDVPRKCLHFVCITYEPYDVPGVGSSPGYTECYFISEDCNGSFGELPVIFDWP